MIIAHEKKISEMSFKQGMRSEITPKNGRKSVILDYDQEMDDKSGRRSIGDKSGRPSYRSKMGRPGTESHLSKTMSKKSSKLMMKTFNKSRSSLKNRSIANISQKTTPRRAKSRS
jgi:hypothetical protein